MWIREAVKKTKREHLGQLIPMWVGGVVVPNFHKSLFFMAYLTPFCREFGSYVVSYICTYIQPGGLYFISFIYLNPTLRDTHLARLSSPFLPPQDSSGFYWWNQGLDSGVFINR